MIDDKSAYTAPTSKKVNGVIEIGYTNYNEKFYTCLTQLTRELESYPDYKYSKHIAKILKKPIQKLKKSHISTYITWLLRGERITDGLIASEIDSGRFKEILLRLKELY